MTTKKKWNGLCEAGKHGLDFQGQPCDLCPDDVRARDKKRREAALLDSRLVMEAVDTLADTLRGPMRRALGLKRPITTFHRGLQGSFTVSADHCDPVPGLHIYVHGRLDREGNVVYRMEVTGPSELTEREVAEVVRLLATHRLEKRRRTPDVKRSP